MNQNRVRRLDEGGEEEEAVKMKMNDLEGLVTEARLKTNNIYLL